MALARSLYYLVLLNLFMQPATRDEILRTEAPAIFFVTMFSLEVFSIAAFGRKITLLRKVRQLFVFNTQNTCTANSTRNTRTLNRSVGFGFLTRAILHSLSLSAISACGGRK